MSQRTLQKSPLKRGVQQNDPGKSSSLAANDIVVNTVLDLQADILREEEVPKVATTVVSTKKDENEEKDIKNILKRNTGLVQKLEKKDISPYLALQIEAEDPVFIGRIATSLKDLIVAKIAIYEERLRTVMQDIQAYDAQIQDLTEEERSNAPGRFLYVVNKQLQVKLQQLLKKAKLLSIIFFEEQGRLITKVTPDVSKKITVLLDNLLSQTTYYGRPLVATADANLAWRRLIQRHLYEVLYSPNGFYKLQGETRVALRDSIAQLIRSLAFGYKVFRTKYINMILMGPPGIGKTTIAQAIGYIIGHMYILFNSSFYSYTASDFIAQFEGQTSAKTRSNLTTGLESVTFLDEAYALTRCRVSGPTDPNNNLGLDAVNEMVDFMSKYQGLYMLIIAGYEKPIKDCFLLSNEGLQRRFDASLQFTLEKYEVDDLIVIFKQKLNDTQVDLTPFEMYLLEKAIKDLFDDNAFPNSAADIQALVDDMIGTIGSRYTLFLDSKGLPKKTFTQEEKIERLLVLGKGLNNFGKTRKLKIEFVESNVSFSVKKTS